MYVSVKYNKVLCAKFFTLFNAIKNLKSPKKTISKPLLFHLKLTGDEGDIFSYKTTGGGVRIGQRKGSTPGTSIIYVRFVKRNLLLVDDLFAECLEYGKWNLIAVTYEMKTGQATLYKNGAVLKTINIGSNTIATQFRIRIGSIAGGVSSFSGLISCLQIYDYTLDLESVKQSQYACRKGKQKLITFVAVFLEPKVFYPSNFKKFEKKLIAK